MKTLNYLLLGCIAMWTLSCDETIVCPPCFTPPQELNLQLTDKKTGADLIFSNTINADSIAFFYYENAQRVTLEHETYFDSVNSRAILVTYDISWISSKGIKDFYLYLGDNELDTLFLNVEKRNTECCTYHEWVDFKINNNQVAKDSTDYIYNYKK